MKRAAILGGAFAALLIASFGCGGDQGSSDIMAPSATLMDLSASATTADVGSSVTFTVTAHNARIALKSVAIDFTGDDTWDASQAFDQSSITATFQHVFRNAGNFTVHAEVTDANNAIASKTLPV